MANANKQFKSTSDAMSIQQLCQLASAEQALFIFFPDDKEATYSPISGVLKERSESIGCGLVEVFGESCS